MKEFIHRLLRQPVTGHLADEQFRAITYGASQTDESKMAALHMSACVTCANRLRLRDPLRLLFEDISLTGTAPRATVLSLASTNISKTPRRAVIKLRSRRVLGVGLVAVAASAVALTVIDSPRPTHPSLGSQVAALTNVILTSHQKHDVAGEQKAMRQLEQLLQDTPQGVASAADLQALHSSAAALASLPPAEVSGVAAALGSAINKDGSATGNQSGGSNSSGSGNQSGAPGSSNQSGGTSTSGPGTGDGQPAPPAGAPQPQPSTQTAHGDSTSVATPVPTPGLTLDTQPTPAPTPDQTSDATPQPTADSTPPPTDTPSDTPTDTPSDGSSAVPNILPQPSPTPATTPPE